ncbi:Uu.00g045810.m01.CDS01 [Anthostomella pinea]|uniref:Uu.00g045810.m01.CDS01 n=1 Tax=Anthostomella pinea TaxID=933095 RepID=A0AAI8V664_9PEZI|nr:Uu.00g045810.m01.CDS01 [Anthostomella pinea]
MASASPSAHKSNDLPPLTRYITDHNAQGQAIFSSALPEALPGKTIYNGVKFSLGYVTDERPVSLASNKDITKYTGFLEEHPGIVLPGGTVVRYVDSPPGSLSPMHRTVSLDYGVVIEGEVELVLDSGETRLMRRGDLAVQRGTMHAWRNPSQTEWARMMYVLQESVPLEVGGKVLEEDYGDMEGQDVKSSGK